MHVSSPSQPKEFRFIPNPKHNTKLSTISIVSPVISKAEHVIVPVMKDSGIDNKTSYDSSYKSLPGTQHHM